MKTWAWLAVFLLLIVVAVVTYAATFLPYERAVALVYGKAWFAAIFALLATALAAQVVRRQPRARRFRLLLVHLGVLIIIAGGFITWGLAVRGTLTIREGQTSDKFELDQLALTAVLGSESGTIPIDSLLIDDAKRSDLAAQLALAGGRIAVVLERYVPDPREVLPRILPLDEGFSEPAIALLVLSKEASGNLTLFANSPDESRGAVAKTDFEFIFTPDKDKYLRFSSELESAATSSAVRFPLPPRERIIITTDLGTETINLKPGEAKVGLVHDLAGRQKGSLRILRYVPDFVMDQDMHASSRSDEPNNPAIQVELKLGSQTSTLWLFGKSQAFHSPSLPPGVSIEYRFEDAGTRETSQDERRIIVLAAPGEPIAFIRGSELIARAEVGDTFLIPGESGVQVTVESFWGCAARVYEIIEGAASGETTSVCVRVNVQDSLGKTLQREWVPLGKEVIVRTSEGRLTLNLKRPEAPLGFEVFLERFEAQTYPGSMMPSAYISTVAVSDRLHQETFTCTISPNNPLEYGGFKLHQSAYDQAEDGATVSILGVSRDPGAPAFYIGSVCLVVGMLLHFWRFRRRGKEGE
ncbi:MAG: cytochrome c biogenesis protein ResB [Candidatus Coatesbacteria bacterium]|nr:cytochrome c biogenesis protein ResB [Candidatus Coatesbacteria bacterium]